MDEKLSREDREATDSSGRFSLVPVAAVVVFVVLVPLAIFLIELVIHGAPAGGD